jgi:hypothetical protein
MNSPRHTVSSQLDLVQRKAVGIVHLYKARAILAEILDVLGGDGRKRFGSFSSCSNLYKACPRF